jgi:hypothetical protein
MKIKGIGLRKSRNWKAEKRKGRGRERGKTADIPTRSGQGPLGVPGGSAARM